MSDSLQDQLLALGLAKKKSRKPSRKKGGKARARGKNDISLEAAYRARQRDEKAQTERARADKRAQDLERRRINGEIKALLDGKALNDRDGSLKRNFLYKGKIRSVRVNHEQLAALNAGELALVFLRGDYLVVPPELAERARAISPEHVPDLGVEETGEDEFPVPDDLVW
jgi:uncharacterized protein YaiL (DUF2058 family)